LTIFPGRSIHDRLAKLTSLMPIGALVFALVGSSACGDDDGGGGGGDVADAGGNGTGNVTCTVTATATKDVGARTITGVGLAECDGTASITVETCVQWNPSGAFEDLMCMTTSRAEVRMLSVENLSACGIGTGRSYRARVNVLVDGTAQAEQLSTEVDCE
jgi:hypothetical protein